MKVYCVRFTDGDAYFSTPTLFKNKKDAEEYVKRRNESEDKEDHIIYYTYEDWIFENVWW